MRYREAVKVTVGKREAQEWLCRSVNLIKTLIIVINMLREYKINCDNRFELYFDIMPHTHGVLRLRLTSNGSIIGASSILGERAGDEESLFSHSVRPGVLLPVSRKERFSSLMFVWCLTTSGGDEVSYSNRSIVTQGGKAGAQQRGRRPCLMNATVAWKSTK